MIFCFEPICCSWHGNSYFVGLVNLTYNILIMRPAADSFGLLWPF